MNTTDRWKKVAGRVRIGVIADTHGRLHPAVVEHFADVQHIIHAGDVGDIGVVSALSRLAPVTAVSGNMDDVPLQNHLPGEAEGEVEGIRFIVTHTREAVLERHENPAEDGYDLVVSGHTHRAFVDWHDGVLYLNPGSAAMPRNGGPATIAVVEVDSVGLDPRIIELG